MKKALPSAVKLPSPLQLANLAAAIGLNNSADSNAMDSAVQKAVRLYLRALRFHHAHKSDSLEELTLAVGDTDLHLDVAFAKLEEENPPLYLEMDKRNDTARRYLRKEGLPLQKARSVFENLLELAQQHEMRDFLDSKQQKPTRAERMTQKEYDEKIKAAAIAAGWDKQNTWTRHGYQDVQDAHGSKVRVLSKYHPIIFRQKRDDNRQVYEVNAAVLSALIEWKKARKHSGGVKSRQTAPTEKS